MGRRALLGAALASVGAAAGAAGAVVTPNIPGLGQSAIQEAYNKGLQDGRQAILDEFKRRGANLGAAQTAAKTTHSATQIIALPVAALLARIVGDALDSLVSALNTAQQWVFFLSDVADLIGKIKDLFAGWQSNLDTLAVSVDELTVVDIESAVVFTDITVDVLPELLLLA